MRQPRPIEIPDVPPLPKQSLWGLGTLAVIAAVVDKVWRAALWLLLLLWLLHYAI